MDCSGLCILQDTMLETAPRLPIGGSMHFRGSKPDPYGEEGRKINGENGRRSGPDEGHENQKTRVVTGSLMPFTSLLSPNFAHGLQPEYDMLETCHHLYVSCLHRSLLLESDSNSLGSPIATLGSAWGGERPDVPVPLEHPLGSVA